MASDPVWAYDAMKRTTSITQVSPGRYHAVVSDKGTFQAFASSDVCAALDPNVKGSLIGRFVEDFMATPNFARYTGGLNGLYSGTEPSSSGQWIANMFSGDPAFAGSMGDYSWTYASSTSSDVMVQNTAGVTGPITS